MNHLFAPESTTNSLSSGLRFDAGRHLFSAGEKNVALSSSCNFNTLLASFHAASRAPCSCHSVSSWDRSSNFGALGLRSWGSPGQIYPSEGFWPRISVWHAIAFVSYTRWIGFRMSVPFRRIDFGGVMSWNTQPNCRASDDWRLDDFCPNFSSLLFSGFPDRSWRWSVKGPRSCQSPFFSIATALLSSFFGPFSPLFINLTMCIRALLSQSATTLGLVKQAFRRVPLFTEWIIASSSKVILARPSRHSTTGTFSSGTSGSQWFSLILLHERTRKRIRLCHFSTLIDIVAETAIVSFHTLPDGFPLPTISKNSLYTLFCSLILDHGFLLKISFLIPKFLFRMSCSILLFTIVFNLWLSGPNFIWWISRSYNSNTVLCFSDSRVLNLYNPPRYHQAGFSS